MALIHRAQLIPGKAEMLQTWLAGRSLISDRASIEIVGTYRFDDPNGEVGIETFLIAAADRILQAPVTYRGEPLDGADEYLITTMEHSVLGRRWVYDAAADHVYAGALARTILTGGAQAELHFDYAVPPEKRNVTTRVRGSGNAGIDVPTIDSVAVSHSESATTVAATGVKLEIFHVIDVTRAQTADHALAGTWPGQSTPALLGVARLA